MTFALHNYTYLLAWGYWIPKPGALIVLADWCWIPKFGKVCPESDHVAGGEPLLLRELLLLDEFSVSDEERHVIRVTRSKLYGQVEITGSIGLIDLLCDTKYFPLS